MGFYMSEAKDIWSAIFGLLANDEKISEVEANGRDEFFVKVEGKRKKIGVQLSTDEEYCESIEKFLIPHIRTGEIFTGKKYLFEGPLDTTLPNGVRLKGRVHIGLPPTVYVPQITIARKSKSLYDLSSIANKGSMSPTMLKLLKDIVKADCNVVFSGGTGAGKTTLLEATTKEIDNRFRIGVAEDTPELVLSQANVTYWNSVPWTPGMDPNNVATLSWVIRQQQRNRIDKIIVGETRGEEFADFLTAANAGVPGCFTTLHADNPRDCIRKMTNFAIKGNPGLNEKTVNREIAQAIDFVVQLIQVDINGKNVHRIASIQEVSKTISSTDASIASSTIIEYDKEDDSFVFVGNLSDNMREHFKKKHIEINDYIGRIGEREHSPGREIPQQSNPNKGVRTI